MTFTLNAEHVIHGCNKLFVGFGERFNIHNAAFALFGNSNGGGMQQFRILFQKLIRHIRDSTLRFNSLTRMLKPECNDHLALPKGNCVHNGGLYFFNHHRVVVLNQANLRCHLNGDVSGEFKVINLLFEPCAHIGKIACLLSILG